MVSVVAVHYGVVRADAECLVARRESGADG